MSNARTFKKCAELHPSATECQLHIGNNFITSATSEIIISKIQHKLKTESLSLQANLI